MIDAIHSNAQLDNLFIEEGANNFKLGPGHSSPHLQNALTAARTLDQDNIVSWNFCEDGAGLDTHCNRWSAVLRRTSFAG